MSAINARCFVTQQTIAKGDSCRVVVIRQGATYEPVDLVSDGHEFSQYGLANAPVYPNCMWQPISGFLPAVYDDYGLSSLTLTTAMQRSQVLAVVEELYFGAFCSKAGANPVHDLEFDLPSFIEQRAPILHGMLKDRHPWIAAPLCGQGAELEAELQLCWTYVSDLVRRYRVFVQSSTGTPLPVQLAVVHEQAYMELQALVAAQTDYAGKGLSPISLLARSMVQARQKSAELCVADESRGNAPQGAFYFVSSILETVNVYNVGKSMSTRLLGHALHGGGAALYENRIDEAEFIRKAVEHLSDLVAVFGIEFVQAKFSPMTFNGADTRNRVGQAYAQLVQAVSAKVCEERIASGYAFA